MERVLIEFWIVVIDNFGISLMDEAEVGNFFFSFKGPHSKYFRLTGYVVSVPKTQFYCCATKAAVLMMHN